MADPEKKIDSPDEVGIFDRKLKVKGRTKPEEAIGPKRKTPRRRSGRTLLQKIGYRNSTWFVKREMQKKEQWRVTSDETRSRAPGTPAPNKPNGYLLGS